MSCTGPWLRPAPAPTPPLHSRTQHAVSAMCIASVLMSTGALPTWLFEVGNGELPAWVFEVGNCPLEFSSGQRRATAHHGFGGQVLALMEVTSRLIYSNWGSGSSSRMSGPTWESSSTNYGRRSDRHRSCRLPVRPLASPALAPPVPRTTAPSVLRRRRAGRGPSPEGPVTAVDADQAAAAGRAGKQRECGGASGVAARGRGMRHPQPTGE